MRSALFEGKVRHRRFSPTSNEFSYSVFMAGIDLDHIESTCQKSWLWSFNRFNLMQIRRQDYLPDEPGSLKSALVSLIQQHHGSHFDGDVMMLTNPRSFGVCFNPVTFYFCYEKKSENLQFIVAQINNTPWNERHAYVLSVEQAKRNKRSLEFAFDKDFHVSPFMPMEIAYRWVFSFQDDRLLIHMECQQQEDNMFDATMVLDEHPFTAANANAIALAYPFMCLKVLAGIYWQALKLFAKRTPFYSHPDQVGSKIIEENDYARNR